MCTEAYPSQRPLAPAFSEARPSARLDLFRALRRRAAAGKPQSDAGDPRWAWVGLHVEGAHRLPARLKEGSSVIRSAETFPATTRPRADPSFNLRIASPTMRWGFLTLAVLLAAVLGGCGGDSTTIITQIQTTEEATEDAVMMNFGSQEFTEPTEFSFSVNGDLVADHLTWENWGAASATGSGSFAFRDYPSTRRVAVGGVVTVSGLSTCHGTNYYTQTSFEFNSKPPFEPQAIELPTPCD